MNLKLKMTPEGLGRPYSLCDAWKSQQMYPHIQYIMLKDQLTVEGRYKRHSCSKGLEVFIHLKIKKGISGLLCIVPTQIFYPVKMNA